MGDVALNYRYQLINKERIAIAPSVLSQKFVLKLGEGS
jgi:hypothetical protein